MKLVQPAKVRSFMVVIRTAYETKNLPVTAASSADALLSVADRLPIGASVKVHPL